MTAAIRAAGLEKRFGAVIALRGVDLAVAAGGALAVLGPNGAGKSTLLQILAGLARPSAGSVEIAAVRDRADARATRRAVGFVGHATRVYAELDARENLLFAARLYGVANARERVEQLLAEQGLEPWAERRVRTFSRGLAQRLSIARALVHDPPILLLDEPFTGLDAASADRLAARFRTLRDEGRTLVLVTHDLQRARELTDTELVLSRGRVVGRDGPAAEPAA